MLRDLVSTSSALSMLLLFVAPASTVEAQDPTNTSVPQPIRFMALLDGVQSIAVNSTALETRPGTGVAMVTFDPVSGDLSYDIRFTGLQDMDITMGPPDVNPDGSTPAPGTVNGNIFPNANLPFGAGLFLLHFHVGARGANGPIPIDIVAPTGPALGVETVSPDPIFGATEGRVTGRVNVFDLDDQVGDLVRDGILLNGVPIDGRNDGIGNAVCTDCGFIEAILSDNVYVNIHTFNNPFGETRGQLLAATCTTPLNTIQGLRSRISTLGTDASTRLELLRRLRVAERRLEVGAVRRSRAALAGLAADVIELSTRQRAPLGIADANDLNCAIANVVNVLVPDTSGTGDAQAEDGGSN